ncbi:MAG: hypothetical protein OXH83_08650 [Bryobacterales bacterium]|nr:hypothetical protein [Bryobacterales bacterium]
MDIEYRWDRCIVHRDDDVDTFLAQYLGKSDRKIFLVAGAGFDPRACAVAARLRDTRAVVHALLIKEERPNPTQELSDRADANKTALLSALAEQRVESIDVFGSDGAVVGGRNVVSVLNSQRLDGTTDVVVDISALSVGTSFPIIRYFVESIVQGTGPANLHVFVAHDPHLDAGIRARASDIPSYVHGFKGCSTLYDTVDAARLWLPQLATGRRQTLTKLYDFVRPHDTCPILPFPAVNPRLGDELAEEYLTELESTWHVDTRNIVYADEGDPLDLYRTILKLDDLRQSVFEAAGGSMLILSPLGSKVMALGALLAALNRDLPVAHLESIGYELKASVPAAVDRPSLIHVWLEGEVYPQPRPALPMGGSPPR